jgi:hypothetical protein
MLLQLSLICTLKCIGALPKDCLELLCKLLHLVVLARPRAGGLGNIIMSIGASPYVLASSCWLGLLYLVDGVNPILQKSKPDDSLNHKHEVRSIWQPLPPILSSKP